MAAIVPQQMSPQISTSSSNVQSCRMSRVDSIQSVSLQQPSKKSRSKSTKFLRRFRSVCRSFPIMNPHCRLPSPLQGGWLHEGHLYGGTRVTGTIFGCRKSRVNLVIQESPRSLPLLVMELAVPTGKLIQDIGIGLVRIAMECEKHTARKNSIMDEPVWTLYYNSRKSGYAVKREPTGDDLLVLQMLHAASMGAGVLPIGSAGQPGGEITYLRSQFERVVGSKDSETYYMMNPSGSGDNELSIFFVRL